MKIKNYADFERLNEKVYDRMRKDCSELIKSYGLEIEWNGSYVAITDDSSTILTLKWNFGQWDYEGDNSSQKINTHDLVYLMNTPRTLNLLKLAVIINIFYNIVQEILEYEEMSERLWKEFKAMQKSGPCNMLDRECFYKNGFFPTEKEHQEYITKYDELTEKYGDDE